VEENPEQLHQIMDAIPDLLWTARPNGQVDYCNQSMLNFIGLSREEFQSKGWLHVLHPDDTARARQVWQEAARTNQAIAVELRMRRFDGEYRYFLIRTTPLLDATGHVCRWYGAQTDITERKQVELALQKSDARYRALFELNPDGIIILDAETTRIIDFNEQACWQLGYTHDEFSRLSLADIETAEMAEERQAHGLKIAQAGREDFLARHRTKQGELRHVFVTAQLIDTAGRPTYYCILRDVTGLVQADESMRESEERFRTLFETMTQGVIYHQSDGKIISANPAAQHIVGLSLEQLQGRSPTGTGWRAIYEDGTEFPREEYPAIQAFRTGRPVHNVVLGGFQPTTGHYVWININAIPLFKPGETKPYQVYVTLDNISARRRQEDVLMARLHLIDFARTHSVRELLRATLDEAGRLVSSPLGFYHFVDPEQEQISLQVWSTRTPGEPDTAAQVGHGCPLSEAGAWADAARQHQPVIHNQYAALEDARGLPPGFTGLVRELVVPVVRGGQVVAIMGVGDKTSDYNAADLEIVTALADFSWDIVQQRWADQELSAREEQYCRLLNLLPSGVIVHSQDRIELINQAGARLLGTSRPDQLIGSVPVERVALECREELSAQMRQALEQGQEAALVEGRLLRLDGSPFDAAVAAIRVIYSGEPATLMVFNDITERKRASDQIRKALAEKETLLRELYHRTKNNMSVIISLLDLQSMLIQDEQLKNALAASQGRIRAMSLVHEKLYTSSDLSRINLKEYVQDLVDLLRQSYLRTPGRISILTELDDLYVLIDTAIPCGLVLNELLTNALKHAFPGERSGVIQVKLHRTESGAIQLEIGDDGVGMPPGFAPRQDGQMGMQMIYALAEFQLRARVDFCTNPGVVCRLVFEDNLYFARV